MSNPQFHSSKLAGIVEWIVTVDPHSVEECVRVYEEVINGILEKGRDYFRERIDRGG